MALLTQSLISKFSALLNYVYFEKKMPASLSKKYLRNTIISISLRFIAKSTLGNSNMPVYSLNFRMKWKLISEMYQAQVACKSYFCSFFCCCCCVDAAIKLWESSIVVLICSEIGTMPVQRTCC